MYSCIEAEQLGKVPKALEMGSRQTQVISP